MYEGHRAIWTMQSGCAHLQTELLFIIVNIWNRVDRAVQLDAKPVHANMTYSHNRTHLSSIIQNMHKLRFHLVGGVGVGAWMWTHPPTVHPEINSNLWDSQMHCVTCYSRFAILSKVCPGYCQLLQRFRQKIPSASLWLTMCSKGTLQCIAFIGLD